MTKYVTQDPFKLDDFIPFLLKVIEKLKNRELFETEVDILINYLSQFHNFDNMKNQLQHEVNCLLLRKKVLEDEILGGKIL